MNQTSPTPFKELGIHPALVQSVKKAGYDTPTPIQVQAIPVAMCGTDILGCAQTGTGKTAAFALPILHQILEAGTRSETPGPVRLKALVLAPTRELAAQIAQSFQKYGRDHRVFTQVVYGGVSKVPQARSLRRGCHVLVATPGRLLDLMQDRAVSLASLETFVLDEADRMLDMGFIHDVRRIARAVPKDRQTLLFSATMPKEVLKLTQELLQSPVRIDIPREPSKSHPIDQSVYFVEGKRKNALLTYLLDQDEVDRALVFTRTKHGANRLAQRLHKRGLMAAAIHGNKSQASRERALKDLKSGRVRIIVATDVAARGIDVKGLSHVFNFDMPHDAESYVHRIGRTGRAGESGIAISFCSKKDKPILKDIEKMTKKLIERPSVPAGIYEFDQEMTPPPRREHGPSSIRVSSSDRDSSSESDREPRRPRRKKTSSQRKSRSSFGGDAKNSGESSGFRSGPRKKTGKKRSSSSRTSRPGRSDQNEKPSSDRKSSDASSGQKRRRGPFPKNRNESGKPKRRRRFGSD